MTAATVDPATDPPTAGANDRPPARPPIRPLIDRYDSTAQRRVFAGPRYRIGYSVMGEGPPIYIATGICSTRRLFGALLVELSKSFRAIVYSLPGIEPGDGANLKTYGIDDYADDLIALADNIGDQTFAAIGNSYGSSIVLRAADRHPGRIVGAILAGGFVHRPLISRERFLSGMLRMWSGKLINFPLFKTLDKYNHGPELDLRDPWLLPFLILDSGQIRVNTLAAQILAVDRTDMTAIAERSTIPVMVIHGERDRLVPPSHAGALCRLLGNVRIMLIPDAGHLPHLTHPELFAHAAERFFIKTAACGTTCGANAAPPIVALS